MKALEIIRKFKYDCLVNNYSSPLRIDVDLKMAEEMKPELRMMCRYTSKMFIGNKVQYMGIWIHGPKGFIWETNRANKDDFRP